jgi:hypothetical protein
MLYKIKTQTKHLKRNIRDENRVEKFRVCFDPVQIFFGTPSSLNSYIV